MGAPVPKRPAKEHPERSEEYLAHVRQRPCCVKWAGGCRGDVIAHHHGKADGRGGTGLKPSDYRTVPLCDAHHRAFHRGKLEQRCSAALGEKSVQTFDLDRYFFREMVRCLESWLLRDAPPSKILSRQEVF